MRVLEGHGPWSCPTVAHLQQMQLAGTGVTGCSNRAVEVLAHETRAVAVVAQGQRQADAGEAEPQTTRSLTGELATRNGEIGMEAMATQVKRYTRSSEDDSNLHGKAPEYLMQPD